ncbi:MAG: cytochrome c biogenesis protein ResB [Limisphaerales bacterium]
MNQQARLTSAGPLRAAPAAAPPKGKPSKPSQNGSVAPAVAGPQPASPSGLKATLKPFVDFFASLRLTVVCLALGLVLVFWGTMAQVELGLFKAQNEFFRSFFIFWGPKSVSWKIPIFPGGYLVGGVLLINLVAAHFKRFRFTRDKIGIWMTHFGIILLLLGQLLTDMLSRESVLHLREGQAKNYTEATRETELAVIDATEPNLESVVAIPEGLLAHRKELSRPELPFVIRVKQFFPNSVVENRPRDSTEPAAGNQGFGQQTVVRGAPRVTDMEHRDVPSAVIELATPQGSSLGTWLVSEFIDQPQSFSFNNRTYNLSMRLRRFYTPYSIQLLKFQHDIYPGTDIPKNFSSRVLLKRPDTGENREVNIYMNNPLRYAGETYYQADWDKDDHGTILQAVRNPSWLTPYFSCVLVGLGLIVQFTTHLLGFTFKRRTT